MRRVLSFTDKNSFKSFPLPQLFAKAAESCGDCHLPSGTPKGHLWMFECSCKLHFVCERVREREKCLCVHSVCVLRLETWLMGQVI